MLGAIIGDIVGSTREWHNIKTEEFEMVPRGSRFTDDTVMTLAVAEWLMTDTEHRPETLVACMQQLGRKYPNAGYGKMLARWLTTDNPQPYNSFGNGSAMRVSPVGLYANTLEEAMELARITASVSHNHPEGIKGAQATAAAIFMARTGSTKDEIRRFISETFGYDLNRSCDDIRPTYGFDGSCQGTVPESIIAFLDGKDYEDALRLCISLGGDADTMGAITGAIAGAYYNKLPYTLYEFGINKLPDDIQKIIGDFDSRYERNVSCRWRNAEFDATELIRKVKSGEIFI